MISCVRRGCQLMIAFCLTSMMPRTDAAIAQTTGSVVAWGRNDFGQCDVPDTSAQFIAVAAGQSHSLALRADGSVVAWGSNVVGQSTLPDPNTGFVAIAAGMEHNLALKADGSIVAWGANGWGQCDVPEPNSNFVAVAAGTWKSLGLKADGSIVGWGWNHSGDLTIPTPNANFVAVAGGWIHSLGLKANGSILAWGNNTWDQLAVPFIGDFVAMSAGEHTNLGIRADGSVAAWGSGWAVPTPNSNIVAVACYKHNLALRADGSILAWGVNTYGQCNVPDPNTGFLAVAVGYDHSLCIRETPVGEAPYIAVSDVEHCGPGGTLAVPVILRNKSETVANLVVECRADGAVVEILRMFNVPPGASRGSGFWLECASDASHDVLCTVTAVASSNPDSVLFTKSAIATVSCYAVCCQEVFATRLSTLRDPLAPVGFRVIVEMQPVEITRGEGDRFFLRGGCGTSGSLVVDDEIVIGGQVFPGTSGSKGLGYTLGVPIETLMNPVAPIEITDHLPMGKEIVNFRLADTNGPGYGNTAIYLHKTSSGEVTGIQDADTPARTGFALNLRPNPSHGPIRILFEGLEGATAKVSVFDLAGRKVYEFGSLLQPEAELTWNGTDTQGRQLASGIYFVVAKSGSESATRKLVILQ